MFLAYPSAILQMPLAPLWAVLFFLMFLFLGLGSMVISSSSSGSGCNGHPCWDKIGGIQGLTVAVFDEWPKVFRKRQQLSVAAVCFVMYLIGLALVTEVVFFFPRFPSTTLPFPTLTSCS